MQKYEFLTLIDKNIQNFGYHITFVQANEMPSFAYTVGLYEKYNFEIVFAGCIYYAQTEIMKIINGIADLLILNNLETKTLFDLGVLGKFLLRATCDKWNKNSMLGVFDYYNIETFNAFQILPESKNDTLLTPKMNVENDLEDNPIWKFLANEKTSYAHLTEAVIVNLKLLQGGRISQVTRWEIDNWEVFSLNDDEEFNKDDGRIISMDSLLGIDITLLPILDMEINTGFYREDNSLEWIEMG